MTGLIDGLIEINTNAYFRHDDDKKFWVIAGGVWRWATENIYSKLTRLGEIDHLEVLPKDKKEMYWELANKYLSHENEQTKIEASRCAYITEIITSTF